MPRDGVTKKRKKYLGPESDFYDDIKGRAVRIEFNTNPPRDSVVVRLDWVDRYTIGVRELAGTHRKYMLSKQSIHSLERSADDHGATDDSRRL